MIRYLYMMDGGGIYLDVSIDDLFARCVAPTKKLLTGKTREQLNQNIETWLKSFAGEIRYVTTNANAGVSITFEQIEANLKCIKRDREINLHLARRLAGEFDVVEIYSGLNGIKFYVHDPKAGWIEFTETLLKDMFREQGYYKKWKLDAHGDKRYLLPSGMAKHTCLAPIPIWTITYCAS